MVSIVDVARRAGVSPTTVSHALSGKRAVSPPVRDRVRSAMTELGYVPRRSAQNLASGRTRLVGLIVPDISNGYFAALAKGVEEAVITAEYNLVLCNSGFDLAREVLYLETIRSRAVDGVVYAAGAPPTDSELAGLLGDMPLVLVDEEIPGSPAPAFVSDNVEGGRAAAAHLLGLGHTRGAFISARDLQSSNLRGEGFGNEWTHAGCPDPEVVVGDFTFEGGLNASRKLAGRASTGELTAVFAANDLMALGVIAGLEQAGLRVPTDISVVGFDDADVARFARPRLTTIRQQVSELGRGAATALLESLATGTPLAGGRRIFDVELVARESTGPVPDRPPTSR